MSNATGSIAADALSDQLVSGSPIAGRSEAAFSPVLGDESVQDEAGVLEWFTDLGWHQVVPIATVAGTLLMGLMLVISFVAFGG